MSEAPQAGGGLGVLWRLLRPTHWVKNIFVFAPLIFAQKALDLTAWPVVVLTFGGFCLLSSAVYILNDIHDAEDDRRHPVKRTRPLASGAMGVTEAMLVALACLAVGLTLCGLVRLAVTIVGLCYVGLNVLYTLWLRRWMIVDVMCVALGFVLRAVAGALAISVFTSPWLLACTFTLCMFLAFTKRRYELAQLGQDAAERERLSPYSLPLLDQFINISAAVTIVCYALYTIAPRTVYNLQTHALVLSVPFVVFCVFRLIHLAQEGRFTDPTEAIVKDWPFATGFLLWAAYVAAVATWPQQIQDVLGGLIG